MKGILRRSAVLLAVGAWLVALLALAAPAQANNHDSNHDHADKVWVCKYVGKPGVNERLKGGKNPINVNDSATRESEVIGAAFNDAQGRSVIVAAGTKCPAPVPPTTTTTVVVTTTTTPQCEEDCEVTTSTTSTTLLPSTTTTTVPSVVTTTTVRRLTPPSKPVVTVPKPPTTTAVRSAKPTGSLPFTGSDTGAWLILGLVLLGAGGVLVGSAKQHRKQLP